MLISFFTYEDCLLSTAWQIYYFASLFMLFWMVVGNKHDESLDHEDDTTDSLEVNGPRGATIHRWKALQEFVKKWIRKRPVRKLMRILYIAFQLGMYVHHAMQLVTRRDRIWKNAVLHALNGTIFRAENGSIVSQGGSERIIELYLSSPGH